MNRTAAIRIKSDTGLALGRDVKSVHRDIHALIGIGLVEKDGSGNVLVPFSRIRTEFELQPRQAA